VKIEIYQPAPEQEKEHETVVTLALIPQEDGVSLITKDENGDDNMYLATFMQDGKLHLHSCVVQEGIEVDKQGRIKVVRE
jgi:hypothetical protein